MELLPQSEHPLVIRTDFGNQPAWETICELIRAPVHEGSYEFHAYVEFLEDTGFGDLTEEGLLARVAGDYNHTFLFVVDRIATQRPEFPCDGPVQSARPDFPRDSVSNSGY